MKSNFLILLIIATVINSALFAQSIQPFKKGDQIPLDVTLGKIINYKSKKVNFSDFEGKLLILDFWHTHCGPCRAALPELERLQKKFRDSIAIIPVDFESDGIVSSYFKKMNLKLPSIVEDTTLSKMFPHIGVPWEVWIDGKGKILGYSDEVIEDKIKVYLQTGKLNLKDITRNRFDFNKPLFVDGNGKGGEGFLYRSILTNHIDGFSNAEYVERDKANALIIKSFVGVNVSALQLYTSALTMNRRGNLINPSKTIIETKDSVFHPMNYYMTSSLKLPHYKDTLVYCYNLSLPGKGIGDSLFFRKYVLDDLNRSFGLNGRIEKRSVDVWLVKKSGETKKMFINVDKKVHADFIYNNPNYDILQRIKNVSFSDFLSYIQSIYYASPILINESGYTAELIDIQLDILYRKDKAYIRPWDINNWKKVFNKYGLDIIKSKREQEVLVLTIPDKETPTK